MLIEIKNSNQAVTLTGDYKDNAFDKWLFAVISELYAPDLLSEVVRISLFPLLLVTEE